MFGIARAVSFLASHARQARSRNVGNRAAPLALAASAPNAVHVLSGSAVNHLFHADAHHDGVLGADFAYSANNHCRLDAASPERPPAIPDF